MDINDLVKNKPKQLKVKTKEIKKETMITSQNEPNTAIYFIYLETLEK